MFSLLFIQSFEEEKLLNRIQEKQENKEEAQLTN